MNGIGLTSLEERERLMTYPILLLIKKPELGGLGGRALIKLSFALERFTFHLRYWYKLVMK